ncbi:universal stress protein [Sediminicola arcticus]|jgi:nucleotide-binding universal stress UspA family protein|uniref:Universal stress protein n=1 Tax=Sediminicola arcticus TaxID=1574308 RepID=A0ABV2SS23_9FLAO
MKTILYATDYSQNSVAALLYAHTICFKLKAKLLILHVFDEPMSLATKVSLAYLKKEQELYEMHQMKLEAFCYEHLKDRPIVTDRQVITLENRSSTDGILEAIVTHSPDMVAVGTKGVSALKEFLLGSTAIGLIKKAPCSVLTVPQYTSPAPLKTLVYATDFEEADIFAIRQLVKIAKPFKAAIKIVHITTKAEYEEDRKVAWLKKILEQKINYKPMGFERIFSEDISKELHAYMERSEVSILGMLERKDSSLLRKFFHKDLVIAMESYLTIPLLCFKVGGL